MATHFRKLTITDIRQETNDCISIAFEIPAPLQNEFGFKQGQNITLRLLIDKEELRRSYSICSSPLENELRVAIKKMPQGKFSSFAHEFLKKGDAIEVMAPTGKFYTEIDPLHAKNYLAFAAGSGITPILSIIKTVLSKEPHSEFTLVYGNRNRSSIIFREQLEDLKNRYLERFTIHHILSREHTDAPINHGRIDADKCRQLGTIIDMKAADEIFLCGPEQMIFSVKDWLMQEGIDSKKIHFELFNTPGQSATTLAPAGSSGADSGATSQVTIRLDGVSFGYELPYEGSSVLDSALQQGADLPYACKGGVCATCRARLVSGQVHMDSNYALEPEELAAGFILTCQAHPRSEKIVVDFDAK